LRRKIWEVSPCDKELAAQLAEQCSLNPFAAYLAVSRGFSASADIEDFFDPEPELTVDPFSLPDMQEAVERINRALDGFERIAIFGDYDTDGVTATAILYTYLEARGADVLYAVPDRLTEGYGITTLAVERLQERGVRLIITVDNGINAFEAADRAKELGIDLVITDHHKPEELLPVSVAVVDPHREDCDCPFREYSGAGVAFKLVCAMEGETDGAMLEEFGDLAAIGTVGDIVPLRGENRAIVRRGLRILNESPRACVSALLEAAGIAGKPITANLIGYRLSPRINAAGRMGSAELALELLLCDDPEAAAACAAQLNDVNLQRQAIEQEMFEEARKQIMACPECVHEPILIVEGLGWHDGVIGIVAAKLMERYGKPCIVLSIDGDTAKGSGRSYEGFSLYDAVYSAVDCLQMFGGHHNAVGMTLAAEMVETFRRRMRTYTTELEMPFPLLKIDCRIQPASVKPELLAVLDTIEPYGAGNPQPVFGLYGMTIEAIFELSGGKYLRLRAAKNNHSVFVMHFGGGRADFPYGEGDVVDLAVTLERNIYHGEERVSVSLRDIKPARTDETKVLSGIRLYDALRRGRALTTDEARRALPDRALCAKLYRYLKAAQHVSVNCEALCAKLGDDGEKICAIRVALDAMLELGLLDQDAQERIAVPEVQEKVNLEDAKIMLKLKAVLEQAENP